ncbi:hypothetical protein [uncultured Winogradskyella sp.]|uniref:hypothetical protein n=1 Tax=Winogradskyella sp. 4-2091 TaxID=3381659 RepID=UPI00263581DC|nr:hypothetical protein [uncultured Winogradskyella sp.]
MFKKIILFIIAIGFFNSCNNDDDNDSEQNQLCDSSNTTFNQLYTDLLMDVNNQEEITLDVINHAYTFEVLSNESICKIGYSSQPSFETYPYLIEIYDNTNDMLLYSENHTFSSSITEYVAINPVNLVSGNSYTIKRVQNNSTNDITIFIGRIVKNVNNDDLNFPISNNNLIITSATFGSQSSQQLFYFGIPYIDLVFEE